MGFQLQPILIKINFIRNQFCNKLTVVYFNKLIIVPLSIATILLAILSACDINSDVISFVLNQCRIKLLTLIVFLKKHGVMLLHFHDLACI